MARSGDSLTPSFTAQILALKERAPYAAQRLRFGRGAGLYLGNEVFVPLEQNGTATPKLSGDIVRLSALELMTPSLQDASSQAVDQKLGAHKVIVLGVVPSGGEAQSRTVAWALALPKMRRVPAMVEWIAAAVAALLGLWQLRFHRFGALFFGVGVTAAMLAAALVEFQTGHWWCPAVLPGGLAIVATLFCFLWPHRAKAAPLPTATETKPAETPA